MGRSPVSAGQNGRGVAGQTRPDRTLVSPSLPLFSDRFWVSTDPGSDRPEVPVFVTGSRVGSGTCEPWVGVRPER